MKRKMPDETYDQVRLEKVIGDRIRELSDKEGRTIMGQIRIMLEHYEAERARRREAPR